MKPGQLVMLIGTDGYMPPMGAVGEIVVAFDGEDYGVMFPRHPCPVQSPEWYVPPHMLMPIDSAKGVAPGCRHIVTLTRIGEAGARCVECGGRVVGDELNGRRADTVIIGGAPEDGW